MTQDELLKLIDQAAEEGWAELDLTGQNLTELPSEIGKLTQLEVLILGKWSDEYEYFGNRLTALPPEIGLLSNLKILQVAGDLSDRSNGNQLSELPPEIGQLQSLQQLDLSENQLSALPPEIGQLQSLQQLDLSENQLSALPPEIAQLQSLQQLYLRSNQLSALPPEIAQLQSLLQLDLSYNQLSALPPKIGQLQSLQQLDLSSNQLSALPPEIGQLQSLQQLYLRSNQLSALPPEIGQLQSLLQLYLSSNQLSALPPEIGQLQSLQQLYLSSNQLSALPPEIGQLQSLLQLDLRDNQLSALPPEIGQLQSLLQLDLRDNQLSALPPEIGQLQSLLQLDPRYNQLSALPPEIGQLQSLQQLDLRDNQLSALPPEIGQLQSLQQLDLSENQLSALPPEIAQLQSLLLLDLRYNQLSALPPEIAQLQSLLQLYLRYNQLSALPPEIAQLQSLLQLDLRSNQLSALPPEIGQLQSLLQLDLRYNQLSELPPEIGQLQSLLQLDLRSNQLSALPPELGLLQKLQILELDGNQVEDPPPEIVDAGTDSILNYLRQQLEQGKDYLYEAKFLIVGEGGAGKTSLAKKLLKPDCELDAQETSTEGIDVIRWDFPLRDGTPFRANIWDFGGQEIYHATHQFFLTKRSLYALVVDTRQDNTDLYYWLNVVNLLSDSSPTFIIKNEKQDRQCEVNEPQLRSEFLNLEKVLATNLATNRGLNRIKTAIEQRISLLPHVGTSLPKKWVDVRRALETDKRNYISTEEYIRICKANGFSRQTDQLQLSDYLHDLGVCLHFQKDPVLKNTIILKPEWGTAAVYKALDTKEVRANLGRFTRAQLDAIWNDDEYAAMRDELLQLMMRFKLCYEIPGCPQHYIAPQLLALDSPDYNWEDNPNLLLRYRYSFMPKGIFTRLVVELHEFIENQQLVWKTGAVFTNGTARAAVIEHYPKREIRIRVSGHDQKRWLSVITHELEKIHRSYDRLQYQTLIPCNCPTCKNSQTPHEYPYDRLQKFLRDRKPIQCQESYEMVDVRRLLDDILYQSPEIQPDFERGIRSDDNPQGLPLQDVSPIFNSAQKQTYQEAKPKTVLNSRERLKLFRKLKALPQAQFEELVFALNPPQGVLPSSTGAQGSRAKELLDWAEGPTGCELQAVLDILNDIGITLTD
ncbi:MAG: leucine-rich repeat domain-containing protein [Leptolyngbya sp. SIO1E4]|nr:leucine-rich repeat domain-containing protein [Leptolyngbya sp. SIO1E4]